MKTSRYVDNMRKKMHRCKKIKSSLGDSSSYQVSKQNFNAWLNKAKKLSVERDGDTFFKISRSFKGV